MNPDQSELRERCDQIRLALYGIDAQANNLVTILRNVACHVNMLEERFESRIFELTSQLDASYQDYGRLREEVSLLEDQNYTLRHNTSYFETRISDFERANVEMTARIDVLEAEVREHETWGRSQGEQIDNYHDQVHALTQENQELKDRIFSGNMCHQELTTSLHVKNREYLELQGQLEDLQQKHTSLEEVLAATQEELATKQRELEAKQAELEHLRANCIVLDDVDMDDMFENLPDDSDDEDHIDPCN